MGVRNMSKFWVWAGAFLLATTALPADEVKGADAILCASAEAIVCTEEDGCESGPPWSWNIPSFIRIDLKKEQLATTEASGENRVTPIRTIYRQDGRLFLQGSEAGRAFSFVVNEATGFVTVAVAWDDFTVSVFGSCTPLPK